MLPGISWKANSSIEKFQKGIEVGGQCIHFFEYLFPRLLPSCLLSAVDHMHNVRVLTQTSNPFSTSMNGKHRSSSVKQTHTSLFLSKP